MPCIATSILRSQVNPPDTISEDEERLLKDGGDDPRLASMSKEKESYMTSIDVEDSLVDGNSQASEVSLTAPSSSIEGS